MNQMVRMAGDCGHRLHGTSLRTGFDAEKTRVARATECVMKTARGWRTAQDMQRLVERSRVEHRPRENHARHARCGYANAQIVDGLHETGAAGGKGVTRERSGGIEA